MRVLMLESKRQDLPFSAGPQTTLISFEPSNGGQLIDVQDGYIDVYV